jgi:HK97 family phage portal protein
MGFFNNIKKNIMKLPGLRNPENDSLLYEFMNNYHWAFTQANKNTGDLQTYYDSYNNVFVKSCIKAYIRYSLINGFTITNNYGEEVNPITANYLNNLFNDPQGKLRADTFATLNDLIWKSWKLTGDCFIEVNYKENYGNIPIGFKHIPTELICYHNDTSQWGLRNTDYRFEDDEIIHIYEPRPEAKNYLWGISEIDSIGLSIALEFSGLKHNKEMFDNNGMDPRGILSFDKETSNVSIQSFINRMKQDKNKKGLLTVKGATYQSTGNNNRDLDFLNLLNYSRDRILIGFQVPPAVIGIVETAHLGSGTGDSQEKSFNNTLSGDCKIIENAFNKVLGRSGFKEVFEYNHMDLENKLTRAQIEDIQLKNGVKSINEVRLDYGLNPVDWGDLPLNQELTMSPNMGNGNYSTEVKSLEKALTMERLRKEYQ